MLFAIHACVNGPSSSLAVPSKIRGTSGSARAPMRQRCAARQLAVRRSAGALAASRQQSYGCAHRDVCWRSTCTTFNIITIIPTYICHGWRRNVYASGGLCVFLAPYSSLCNNLHLLTFRETFLIAVPICLPDTTPVALFFFWSPNMHRSLTAKILLRRMFVRCAPRKTLKLPDVDGYRF